MLRDSRIRPEGAHAGCGRSQIIEEALLHVARMGNEPVLCFIMEKC